MATPDLISLKGRGWSVVGKCVALIRLEDRPGFAVGVQTHLRSGGVGRVWCSLKPARQRAAYLSQLHSLPVIETL